MQLSFDYIYLISDKIHVVVEAAFLVSVIVIVSAAEVMYNDNSSYSKVMVAIPLMEAAAAEKYNLPSTILLVMDSS